MYLVSVSSLSFAPPGFITHLTSLWLDSDFTLLPAFAGFFHVFALSVMLTFWD